MDYKVLSVTLAELQSSLLGSIAKSMSVYYQSSGTDIEPDASAVMEDLSGSLEIIRGMQNKLAIQVQKTILQERVDA